MLITRRRPLYLLDIDERPGGQPAEGADTPDGTGTETTDTAQANWEDRYKEAQGWGTRLAQENAQLQQEAHLARALRSDNAEERQAAFEALGLSLVDDDTDDTAGQFYDELPPHVLAKLAKVDELEQRFQQSDAQAESEANYAAYRGMVDPQLEQMQVPAGLRDVVAEAALALPALHTPQGPVPDLEGAWRQLVELADHFQAVPDVRTKFMKAWAATKPRTALTTAAGRDGTGVPEFADGEQRRAHILARVTNDR